jgi:hypothetical protein
MAIVVAQFENRIGREDVPDSSVRGKIEGLLADGAERVLVKYQGKLYLCIPTGDLRKKVGHHWLASFTR